MRKLLAFDGIGNLEQITSKDWDSGRCFDFGAGPSSC